MPMLPLEKSRPQKIDDQNRKIETTTQINRSAGVAPGTSQEVDRPPRESESKPQAGSAPKRQVIEPQIPDSAGTVAEKKVIQPERENQAPVEEKTVLKPSETLSQGGASSSGTAKPTE